MNKKKILYIHHGVGIGGAAISLLQILQHIKDKNYSPTVVFLEESIAVDFFKKNRVNVYKILNFRPFSHTVIWWYSFRRVHHFLIAFFSTFFILAKGYFLLKEVNPDIIHLNSSPLWAFLILGRYFNIPVVCHVREPLAPGYLGIRRFVIINLIKHFSTVILAISENDGRPWEKKKNLKILYNSVDEEKFNYVARSGKDEFCVNNKIVFIYLGGSSKEKGALILLKIWKTLAIAAPELNIELWILGKWVGAEKNMFDLLKKISFLSEAELFFNELNEIVANFKNIRFFGLCQNVPEMMAKADVLLFPSTVGHFPRPVIEAAFLGIPSIASSFPPLDELIFNYKNGFLVDSVNIEDWVQKMIYIATNHPRRRSMGFCARDLAIGRFGLKYQIDQLDKIYQQL